MTAKRSSFPRATTPSRPRRSRTRSPRGKDEKGDDSRHEERRAHGRARHPPRRQRLHARRHLRARARGRVRVARADSPLRAARGRRDRGAGAPAAAVRALPVARTHRERERPAGGRDPERPMFDDLTPTFATDALETSGLPFGRARASRSAGLRRGRDPAAAQMTDALEGGLDVLVVLAGVRPEEVTEWKRDREAERRRRRLRPPGRRAAQIAEMAIERAKRIAERGGDAVVSSTGSTRWRPRRAARVRRGARDGGGRLADDRRRHGQRRRAEAARHHAHRARRRRHARRAASGTLRADLLGGTPGRRPGPKRARATARSARSRGPAGRSRRCAWCRRRRARARPP